MMGRRAKPTLAPTWPSTTTSTTSISEVSSITLAFVNGPGGGSGVSHSKYVPSTGAPPAAIASVVTPVTRPLASKVIRTDSVADP